MRRSAILRSRWLKVVLIIGFSYIRIRAAFDRSVTFNRNGNPMFGLLTLLLSLYLVFVAVGYLTDKLAPFTATLISSDGALPPAKITSQVIVFGLAVLLLVFQCAFHGVFLSIILGSVIGAGFAAAALKRGADTVNPILAGWFVAFILISATPLVIALISASATFVVYAGLVYGAFDINRISKESEGADADTVTILASVLVSPVILWNKILDIYRSTSMSDLGIRFCPFKRA